MQLPAKIKPLFLPCRYKFLRGGRGSAKSWSVAGSLLTLAAERPLRILCAREVQKSIKQSVHQLLTDQIKSDPALDDFYEILQTEIRGRNSSLILFSGLSDLTADSIKSFEGVDIVWIEEAQSISHRSLNILKPTIRKEGSEIWATYNPELETDPIHQLANSLPDEDKLIITMNWSDNPFFPEVLERERQIAKETMSEADYLHTWEGQCLPAVEGSIYSNEIGKVQLENRLTRVPYDPMLKVHTIWDLGFKDSMAIILAQRAASEIRIIDYLEGSQRIVTDYARELNDMKLNWGDDHLPHDGYATRHQTGKDDATVLRQTGRSVPSLPPVPVMDVEAGIRNARLVFPRIWFNSESEGVQVLFEHLRRYRRKIGKNGVASSPIHDDHSHGADAFRYLCLVADGLKNNNAGRIMPKFVAASSDSWMG